MAEIKIGLSEGPAADTAAPIITSFSIPATGTALTLNGITLTASDATDVTGYFLSEAAATPSPGAGGWSATAPASYTFASEGPKTLYAWARDAAGNVSVSSSASTVIALPSTVTPAAGVESVTLTWSPASGASAYHVYYTPFAGVSVSNSTRLENVASPLVIRGLAPGAAYHFLVTKVVGSVETALGSSVSATPTAVTAQTVRYELVVRETKGIARTDEMVHNGVPIPREVGLFDSAAVHLETAAGTSVDADFEVLSRWGGGLADTTKPVQWLLVTFRATVPASSSTSYFIVSGARANTGNKLAISEDGGKLEVDTGAARFGISKSQFNVLESLALASDPATHLAGGVGGSASIQVYDESTASNKPLMVAQAPSSVTLERAGDLFATVKVTGYFSNPPYPAGTPVKWRYLARYHFHADSPTAILEFSYAFLGNKSGTSGFETWAASDFVRVDKVTLSLPVAPAANTDNYAAAEIGVNERTGASATPLAISQNFRSAMTAPASCDILVGSVAQGTGCTYASRPWVGKWGISGSVGASIRHMRWYEPQALHAQTDRLDLEIVSDKTRLSPYMGAFAGIALTATGGSQAQLTQAGSSALVRLENGLLAWPTRSDVARSEVLGELWDGTANADAQKHWNQLVTVTANTTFGFTNRKMHGFMTYGLPVREWSPTSGYSEFGDTSSWDGYFKGGTFTDYHNAMGNVVRQFAQSGDPELLHTLAHPAARRTLHTQILQGDATSVEQFRLGWGVTGYGGYRTNSNSSHSYFDNLYQYYYLTGDKAVLETLLKAGSALRNAYSRDGSGNLIPSSSAARNSWMGTVDRAGSQQATIYWFLGHASSDPTFLEDFRNSIERGVDRYTALLTAGDKEYVFFLKNDLAGASSPQNTEQVWISSLYYLANAWSYYREFGDVALGASQVTTGRLFAGFNRTLWDYVGKVGTASGGPATGLPGGVWANSLRFSWSGAIKGGALTDVHNPQTSGTSDDFLYLTGKVNLPFVMFQAARLTHSQAVHEQAKTMAQYVINNGEAGGGMPASNYGWSKASGLIYFRSHASACYLAKGLFGPLP